MRAKARSGLLIGDILPAGWLGAAVALRSRPSSLLRMARIAGYPRQQIEDEHDLAPIRGHLLYAALLTADNGDRVRGRLEAIQGNHIDAWHHHLPGQGIVHGLLQGAAEDAAVADAQLLAQVDHLDRRQGDGQRTRFHG